MVNVAIVALALDVRDPDVLAAVVALAPAVGLRRAHLVYVHPADPLADPLMGGVPIEVRTAAAPEGLAGHAAALTERLSGVEVHVHQLVGRPHEEIARLAVEVDADLVVIGRLPASGDQAAWGSRGQLIARHAGRSVLLVPQGTRVELDRLLVGLDFSPRSLEALKEAVAIGHSVEALYAFRVDPGLSYSGHHSPREVAVHIRDNARRHFQDDVLADLPAGSVVPELTVEERDRVSDGLLEHANQAGLVVIGSRGLSPLATMLLGSTAERVAGLCPSPVLIVRNKGEDTGLLRGLMQRISGGS